MKDCGILHGRVCVLLSVLCNLSYLWLRMSTAAYIFHRPAGGGRNLTKLRPQKRYTLYSRLFLQPFDQLIRVIKEPAFCGNRTADQHLCFRYISLQASSHLWLFSMSGHRKQIKSNLIRLFGPLTYMYIPE